MTKTSTPSFSKNGKAAGQQGAPWETLVVFAINLKQLTVQMNMSNVMGNNTYVLIHGVLKEPSTSYEATVQLSIIIVMNKYLCKMIPKAVTIKYLPLLGYISALNAVFMRNELKKYPSFIT